MEENKNYDGKKISYSLVVIQEQQMWQDIHRLLLKTPWNVLRPKLNVPIRKTLLISTVGDSDKFKSIWDEAGNDSKSSLYRVFVPAYYESNDKPKTDEESPTT